jgi:two-component system, NtrC family, C4-dicarboxylate transport sensor histidine kinase DctB
MIRSIISKKLSLKRLIASALALIGIGLAILLSDHFAQQRAVQSEHNQLVGVARLAASSYERQVDKFRLVATTLSADPDVDLLLDTRTQSAASRLNDRLSGLSEALDASVIYLLDANGTTIASSNWNQPDSFMNENYRFRSYFKQAMEQGQWEQFALGTRSRVPGLFVARRIGKNARSQGVIVIKIRFDRLEREWRNSAGTVFVSNAQGVILVTSKPQWRFQTIRKLNEAEQNKLQAQLEFGNAPLIQNELYSRNAVISEASAYDREVLYVEAEETLPKGWQVHVLAPLKNSLASARNFGRLLVLLTAALMAILVTFSVLRRRAIIAGEQRVNAARIADLKDRLVQSNKLSTLGQIAAGVGHEINQPLSAIGIRAQSASKLIEIGRHDEAQDALAEIGALTARAGAITSELRRFSRRSDRQVRPVSLQQVLEGTSLLLGDRLRSTKTAFLVDADDVYVIGDQGRLEQVFVNLIQNALDAMGAGGQINISIDVSGGVVNILICDNGPGISKEIRERLFQPFTTSKEDGVGLGLVICRDIITEFGGELNLSQTRTGTEFIISLKVAEQ